VLKPGLLDGFRHTVGFEGFLQYLAAPGEMATHDWVLGMNLLERSAAIFKVRAKKAGGQLILQLLDATFVRTPKEEADHPVLKNTVDEVVDDFSYFGFPAQLLKIAWRVVLGFR
jgi:hypothetical protein